MPLIEEQSNNEEERLQKAKSLFEGVVDKLENVEVKSTHSELNARYWVAASCYHGLMYFRDKDIYVVMLVWYQNGFGYYSNVRRNLPVKSPPQLHSKLFNKIMSKTVEQAQNLLMQCA